jgi:hypothetical protein
LKSITDELRALKALLDDGALTNDEYDLLKQRLFSETSTVSCERKDDSTVKPENSAVSSPISHEKNSLPQSTNNEQQWMPPPPPPPPSPPPPLQQYAYQQPQQANGRLLQSEKLQKVRRPIYVVSVLLGFFVLFVWLIAISAWQPVLVIICIAISVFGLALSRKKRTTHRTIFGFIICMVALVLSIMGLVTFGERTDNEQVPEVEHPPASELPNEPGDTQPEGIVSLDNEALHNNLNSALNEIGIDVSKGYDLHEGEDWANGKRYAFIYDYNRFDVYVNFDDTINSVNLGVVEIACYKEGYESYNYLDVLANPAYYSSKVRKEISQEVSTAPTPDDIIVLKDGQIGQYGVIDSAGYIDFYIPAGTYMATSVNGNVKIAQVNNSLDDDYSFIAEFTAVGQTTTIEVLSDYHLELTMYGEVELKKL